MFAASKKPKMGRPKKNQFLPFSCAPESDTREHLTLDDLIATESCSKVKEEASQGVDSSITANIFEPSITIMESNAKVKTSDKPTTRKKKLKDLKCSHEGCPFVTPHRVSLNAHLAKTHGESKHLKNCPHCSYSTVHTTHLRMHIETHLPDNQKSYRCHYPDCSFAASHKVMLDTHLTREHDETKYLRQCPHCLYSTALVSNLNKHIKTHFPHTKKPPWTAE